VVRDSLCQRNHHRHLVVGQRLTIESRHLEHLTDLVGMDRAGVVELDAEELLSRLVVVDEVAVIVHHPDRHSQIAGNLTEQDHLHRMLVAHRPQATGFACRGPRKKAQLQVTVESGISITQTYCECYCASSGRSEQRAIKGEKGQRLMRGKIRGRVASLVMLAMFAASFGISTAALAAPVKELRVTVTPAVAVDATATNFTVTITNLGPSAQLGGVEITSPFSVNTVSGVTAPAGKSWTSEGLTIEKVRLTANTLNDRLSPGQSVSVVINATTPDIDTSVNDVDQVSSWLGIGRQANSFNDQMGGNDVTQAFANRQGTFITRDGSGLISTVLGTHQTLVRSGRAVDCSGPGPCSQSDTQSQTTVTVSATGCNDGTLVVDASNLFANQVGAAAFYDYLDGGCSPGTVVTVDIAYPKSLVNNSKALTYIAVYGKDISGLDPNYVGDNVPLPECGGSITVNCVVKAATKGSNAQLRMLLTDPGAGAFR
jgi:hypothetical protein